MALGDRINKPPKNFFSTVATATVATVATVRGETPKKMPSCPPSVARVATVAVAGREKREQRQTHCPAYPKTGIFAGASWKWCKGSRGKMPACTSCPWKSTQTITQTARPMATTKLRGKKNVM